jgi:hypothetical protein
MVHKTNICKVTFKDPYHMLKLMDLFYEGRNQNSHLALAFASHDACEFEIGRNISACEAKTSGICGPLIHTSKVPQETNNSRNSA